MASAFLFPKTKTASLAVDTYEKLLSAGAIMLLAAALTALFKGRADWHTLPWQLWAHLATILTALTLTPVMLLRKRGDRFHRQLGWIWCGAMLATAVISLDLRVVNRGQFSIIHILSIWTIVQVPLIFWAARTHNIARHRGSVRGMVTGALLIAGFFTFPFDRLLGHWLFS